MCFSDAHVLYCTGSTTVGAYTHIHMVVKIGAVQQHIYGINRGQYNHLYIRITGQCTPLDVSLHGRNRGQNIHNDGEL